MIAAVATAWALLAGAFVYVGTRADDPGVAMLLLFVLLTVGSVALLLPVMRSLLRQATALRARLDTIA